VESLTNMIEEQMRAIIDEVLQTGVSRAIESGLVQERILRSGLQEEQRLAAGEQVLVGVNAFQHMRGAADITLHRADPATLARQIERTRRVRLEHG
jgi:methylmalonyl-CoA mutase N-terminal domain/subunit